MSKAISRVPVLIALAALGAVFAAPAGAAPAAGPGADAARFIVVLKDGTERPGRVAERHRDNRGAQIKQVYRHALKGYAARMPVAELGSIRQDPNVAYVERDGRGGIAAQSVPTGIDRVFATANEALKINEEDDVRVDANVAVFDTGIAAHPDLDLVGHINCSGQPCVEGGTDGEGHGTHVAGTIAAIDNNFGVVGVAPGARLWGIKVLNDSGLGQLSELIAGIDWVTATREDEDPENDIDVTNASLRYWCCESSQAFDEALAASIEAGIVHVAAAGNESEAVRYIPGNNAEEITVSAIADYDGEPGGKGSPTCSNRGSDDNLASFSNFGPLIDVAAPGVCILSTLPGNSYGNLSGTSMASPHVAGAAAILAASHKPVSKADVEEIRDAIVEQGNFAWEDTSGDGIQEPLLDVGPGFTWTPPPRAVTQGASMVADVKATLNASVDPKGLETTYQFEYGTTTEYGTKVPLWPEWAGSGSGPLKVSEQIEGLEPGTTYHFRVVATSEGGTSYGEDREFKTTLEPPAAFSFFAFGEEGTGNGQFSYPSGITLDSQGDVWVVDHGNNRLQRFSTEGEYLSQFGEAGSGNGQLSAPADIAIDAQGDIWVADALNNRVQQFNDEGEYLSQFGEEGTGNGQLLFPIGIAIDAQGDIWVTDLANNRVQQFNTKGEYLSQFGELGSGNGQLNFPIGIAIDAEGDVWVADTSNHRVQQFSSEGEYISQFGEAGTGNGQLDQPNFLAIDSAGDIWIADAGNNRVQRFNDEGEYLGQFGEEGSGEGQFLRPVGIAIDSEEDFWVSDQNNNRVQKWVSVVSPPAVSTEPASAVTTESATLNATVNPNGQASSYQFEYGKTTAYGSKAPASPKSIGSGTSPVEVSEGIEGLEAGTTYHFRVTASSEEGTSHGKDLQFTTAGAPAATTEAATAVTHEGATLNATVNPNGLATSYQFECGETVEYGTKVPASPQGIGSGTSAVKVDEPIEGLKAETTYHCRVAATNEAGTIHGQDREFTTAGPPAAATEAASGVTAKAATLNATVNPNGLATSYQFEYGKTTAYGSKAPASPKSAGSGTSPVKVSEGIEGLQAETTYHFRVVATSEAGTAYGDDVEFTTAAEPPPFNPPAFSFAFGEEGSGNGQFSLPTGIAVDSEGNAWVVDHGNNRVQQFSPEGEYLSQFGEAGSGNGQLNAPADIAIDSAGDIWVTDLVNNRVQRFSPEGEYLSQFGEAGTGNGQLLFPIGIAIDSEDDIWVTDAGNSRVQRFSPEGEYLSQFGEEGSGNGQLNFPIGIAIDAQGDIWVADALNHRVQQFSPEGEYLSQFGEAGTGNGQLDQPNFLAIDSEGDIWVTDASNDRVQQFNAEGEFLGQFGEEGSGEGQFLWPVGIAIDSEEDFWVSDQNNNRVQKWVR